MPPVFGPRSPSSARLWSWTEAIGTTREPSEKTRNETSSPFEELLHHDLGARGAELLLRHDRRRRPPAPLSVVDDHRALAGRQAVGLHDEREAEGGPATKASASSTEAQTS